MTSALINAFINKGDQYTASSNDDLAKKSYLQALKQFDALDENNNHTKKIIYKKLIAIEQKNNSPSALLYFVQGLLYFTEQLYQDAKSHLLLGMQADQDGKTVDAKMAKSIAHALDTCNIKLNHFKTKVITDHVAHQNQCKLYYTNKQYSLAVKYISSMISHRPESSMSYYNRALSLHLLENTSLAMHDINTAIWLDKIENKNCPTDRTLEYYKCRRNIHLDNKEFQKSLDDHEFIIKNSSRSTEKNEQAFTDELERRAIRLLKTKNFSSALTYYQVIHHLKPDDEGIKYNINTILQLFLDRTNQLEIIPTQETAVQNKKEEPRVIPAPIPPAPPEVVTTHHKEHTQRIRKWVRRLENNPLNVLRVILYLTQNNLDANDYLSKDEQNKLPYHADQIMQGITENKIDPNEANKLMLALFSNKQAEANCNKLYQFNLFEKFFPKIDDKEEVMRIMRMEDKIIPSLKVIYDCFLNLMPADSLKTNGLMKACFTPNPNSLFSPTHQNQPENTKRENNAHFPRQ